LFKLFVVSVAEVALTFHSSDVSHAPGELLFYLLTIWSAQLLFRQFICAQCVHSAACWHAAVQH